MAPRKQEQFEKMREASKEQIISTALKLFSEKGYHATSIAQIAQEAGISKGLMYNYFASKEKLFEAIMVRGLEAFILAPLEGGKQVGSIELEKMLRKTADSLKNETSFWRLYCALMFQSDLNKIIEPTFSKFRSDFVSTVSSIFTEWGVENPLQKALMLGVQLDGIIINYLLAPEGFPLDDFIELLIQQYCKYKP